ncbi:hypothetical protein CLCR_07744 [Cladophialophora carrionii]|uniref:Uncharacterized protein n=1 Tax=Cladophialophora carrionii TaxID=86049 RepID=A0A1C1CQL6_9EURO|nr:hypothetical protein CLCR_07744 [Cladophialophora carrionii]
MDTPCGSSKKNAVNDDREDRGTSNSMMLVHNNATVRQDMLDVDVECGHVKMSHVPLLGKDVAQHGTLSPAWPVEGDPMARLCCAFLEPCRESDTDRRAVLTGLPRDLGIVANSDCAETATAVADTASEL